MSLAWTPEQKLIAKNEVKALVKLQVQLKHCGGGNFSIVGPIGKKRALALFLVGSLRDEDDRVNKVLGILGDRGTEVLDDLGIGDQGD